MLDPHQLVDQVIALSANKRIWVAYSGGVDSHVLLHLLATSPQLNKVHAIHVDHGLNPDSSKWAQHCAEVAANLKVEFLCVSVDVKGIDKWGMEAAARQARYKGLQDQLTQDDVLLTAQHQHDQAETLLLQLFRGAGPKGLSAMAAQSQLGQTQLLRPFLATSQMDIVTYAEQHKLQWVEDPSNVETQWNRNYIRHKLWPIIEQRWPSAAKTISRSAEHCAETSELLTELAIHDIAELNIDVLAESLAISLLLTLSPPRYRNLLRYWIDLKQLPLPSTVSLQKIIDEVCLAKQDSNPLVCWGGVEVRRYQDQLYIMTPLPKHNVEKVIDCHSLTDISIGNGRVVSWHKRQGEGIKEQVIMSGLTLRFRQGGEQIQPQGKLQHKSLKHLFQQWQVPPWQRDRIPLLYRNDELIAVVGYILVEGYTVNSDEQGFSANIQMKGC